MSRAKAGNVASQYIMERNAGKTLAEIGEKHGVTRQAVSQVLLKAKERGLMSGTVGIDPIMAELIRHLKETVKDLKRGNPIRTLQDTQSRLEVVVRAMDCRVTGGTNELIQDIMAGAPI
jgi:predicted transcriptional regulator